MVKGASKYSSGLTVSSSEICGASGLKGVLVRF
jgi:hypothetical protein